MVLRRTRKHRNERILHELSKRGIYKDRHYTYVLQEYLNEYWLTYLEPRELGIVLCHGTKSYCLSYIEDLLRGIT